MKPTMILNQVPKDPRTLDALAECAKLVAAQYAQTPFDKFDNLVKRVVKVPKSRVVKSKRKKNRKRKARK